jgi:hypothetical protein
MYHLFSGLFFVLLFTACASSNSSTYNEPKKKPIPFVPPGKELGDTWDEAVKYDYEMDIFVTPEYIAYPLKGTRWLLSTLQNNFQAQVCKGGDPRIIFRFVISPNGQLIGVHPIGNKSLECLSHVSDSVIKTKFYPAEHNGENVYMLLSVTVNDHR